MRLVPKNWSKFQHYKDRCPPWIKLHRDLLNDRAFMSLSVASKALAPMLWLLASESQDGCFDGSPEEIEFRTRMPLSDVKQSLKELITKGFLIDASGVLAECEQTAIPETERETESEGEERKKNPRAALAALLAAGVVDQVAQDFIALRKAKRLPITKTALDGIEREAAQAGMTMADAIRTCVERGWGGFKASWMHNQQGTIHDKRASTIAGLTGNWQQEPQWLPADRVD